MITKSGGDMSSAWMPFTITRYEEREKKRKNIAVFGAKLREREKMRERERERERKTEFLRDIIRKTSHLCLKRQLLLLFAGLNGSLATQNPRANRLITTCTDL